MANFLEKPDEVPDGASSGETPRTSNNRGKLIACVVVVLAVLAFVAYRSCSSGHEQNIEPTNTVVSDSTEKENADTVSSVKKESDSEMQANDDNGNVGTPTTSSTSESTTEPRTASSSQKSIEEKAMQVWDGIYGNGTERKSKLGSDYQAVQKRVNEMYRNGYRH